jgi:hypothetical protein
MTTEQARCIIVLQLTDELLEKLRPYISKPFSPPISVFLHFGYQ